MEKKRVLVLGGRGMLGHKVTEVLANDGNFKVDVTLKEALPQAFKHSSVTYHSNIDLNSGAISALQEFISKNQPDFIINAVGAIKQKNLYEEIESTFFVNATLPHLLALFNPKGKVIQISTDCVYKGTKRLYCESAFADAEDLYGRSKACGELTYGYHLTLRTSIIGFELAGYRSLLSWLFSQPSGGSIKGYCEAIFSGLPTLTLSRTILDILKYNPDLSGLYHVAAEPISKFDLLQRINRRFELGLTIVPDKSLKMDRSLCDDRFRQATQSDRPKWDDLMEDLWEDFTNHSYRDHLIVKVQT